MTERRSPSIPGLLVTAIVAVGVALGINRAFVGGVRHGSPPPGPAVPAVDPEAVIEFYRKGIARDPEDFRFHALLAGALVDRARETGGEALYADAERSARESLRLYPGSDSPARTVLARVALARHDFQGALAIVEEAAGPGLMQGGFAGSVSRETASELSAIICDARLALGDIPAARTAVAAVLSIALTQQGLARRAQVELATGREDLALQTLEDACRIDSPRARESSAWVRVLAGTVHASHGRLDEARKLYDAALGHVKDYFLAHLRYAELEAREGKLDGAASRLERVAAVTSAGPSPLVLAARADVEARRGRADAAAAHRERAEVAFRQSLRSGGIGHRADFARFLLRRGRPEDVTEAVSLAREEAKLRRDSETLATLGAALLAARSFAEARVAFADAFAPGWRSAAALHGASEVELALGDRARAGALRDEALAFDPGSR